MSHLNPQQLAAVRATDHPLLVIAGAGSGKTRVITEKIVYLIGQGLSARHIAAVTFTNKAAREMKSRVARLASGDQTRGLRVSTFHALGLDILRREHQALGFKATLSIFDEHDRLALLKELLKHGDGDPESAADVARQIGVWKNRFITPDQALQSATPETAPAAKLYADFARQSKAYNAVDFDDLILLPVLLFRSRPEVLEHWRNRIRYLLVDEYQDTNETQYQLVKLLAGNLGRFTVVGDDDQSIYAWRGAQPQNLVQLQNDFPRLQVIKLEQNYRSTGRILKAANRLIANNPHVFDKRLWSELGPGESLRVLRQKDESGEAQQIVADLLHHKFRHGSEFRDYAVLYRSNHQSRLFEKALREQGVPYFISGGPSFFGYAEVKDIMAYLRLLVNRDDDAALLRIVNVPRREIGPATLEKIGAYANRRHIGLFSACYEMGLEQELSLQAVQRVRRFCDGIVDVADRAERGDTFAVIRDFIDKLGYDAWLEEISTCRASAERRQRNVRELLDWLERLAEEDGGKTLPEVIAKLMLLDILERNEEEQAGDRVSLMTLHAAKGLEFPYVYLVGMEENILPHETSVEQDMLEEERRLAYVGITRAQRAITFSYCSQRKRYGEWSDCQPSRFLEELPEEDLEWAERKALAPEERIERGKAAFSHIRNLLNTP